MEIAAWRDLPRLPDDDAHRLTQLKLPNSLTIERTPFDPDSYAHQAAESDQGETPSEVLCKARWRWSEEADETHPKKESNTRLVRWSDGSTTLHVGNEVYDCQEKSGDVRKFLFSDINEGNALRCQGRLLHRIGLVPMSRHGTSIKRGRGQRGGQKVERRTRLVNADDAMENERLEEMKRKQRRMEERQRMKMEESGLSENFLERRYGYGMGRNRDLDESDDDEEDDDYGLKEDADDGDDDDDEDEDIRRNKKKEDALDRYKKEKGKRREKGREREKEAEERILRAKRGAATSVKDTTEKTASVKRERDDIDLDDEDSDEEAAGANKKDENPKGKRRIIDDDDEESD